MMAPDDTRATEIISPPNNAQISNLAAQLSASMPAAQAQAIANAQISNIQVPTNEEYLETKRQNNWNMWHARENGGTQSYTWASQPFSLGKPIGWAGYHWLRNFHANDNAHYAEYQPNKGGDNRKYYDMDRERWATDKYTFRVICQNCRNAYDVMRPGLNHCDQCGMERDFKV